MKCLDQLSRCSISHSIANHTVSCWSLILMGVLHDQKSPRLPHLFLPWSFACTSHRAPPSGQTWTCSQPASPSTTTLDQPRSHWLPNTLRLDRFGCTNDLGSRARGRGVVVHTRHLSVLSMCQAGINNVEGEALTSSWKPLVENHIVLSISTVLYEVWA